MHVVVQMAIRSISLLLLFACAPYVPTAQGTERLGDATYVYELEQYANAVTTLENNYLSLIESASGEERFNLYRNYNQLMGAWLQVDFVQTLLDLAVAATSRSDEEETRTMLLDHARYILWELDHAIADLDENTPDSQWLNQLWVNEGVHSLLSGVRITVNRMLVDRCASAPCAVGP